MTMNNAPNDPDCEAIRLRGWRAGSVLPPSIHTNLAPYLVHLPDETQRVLDPTDWLIVVSHSCDIVAARMEQEPYVEVLHCRQVALPLTQFKNRRSTRRLHFRPNRESLPDFYLDAHATADRFFLPRNILAAIDPCTDRRLGESAIAGIQAWYALRSERAAWPDDLNDRLGSVREKLERAIRPLDEDTTEIRVAINATGDRFRLAVYLIVDEEVWEANSVEREKAVECFHRFIAVLTKCEGIELDPESRPISGADFTWQLGKLTHSWNFASLTPFDR